MNFTLTNKGYWDSKQQPIRDLQKIETGDAQADMESREKIAKELDAQGYVIDRAIDINGFDPVRVMADRYSLGLPWVPSAFQGVLINPYKLGTQVPTDMSKPWDRSIKVSLDAADYPSLVDAPPPLPPVKPVGALIGNGIYAANIEACWSNGRPLFADGQHFTQDGVEHVFHLIWFWGIPDMHWTLA